MKAKVALLRAFNAPLSVEQIEVPSLAEGQVLVEVEAAGVCGSDVHMWRGRDPRTPLPIILGHEGVGRVADMAGSRSDVWGQAIQIGQRVIWERGVTCGECPWCTSLRQPFLCASRWVYGIHRSRLVKPYLNGCYASHLILDARTQIIPLAEEDDPSTMVAASCSGATAAHAVDMVTLRQGGTVIVFGPGPLGAFAASLSCARGAEEVIVIGGTPDRLELCAQVGATKLWNRHESKPKERRERTLALTHGLGADAVIETSGSLSAASEALDLVRPGGMVALAGFGTPVGDWSLPPFETLVRKNVSVAGVWVSDISHTLQALSLVRQKGEAFAQLVTHRYPLERAAEALKAVEVRRAMKVVLVPNDGA